jgi:hypothetical protein
MRKILLSLMFIFCLSACYLKHYPITPQVAQNGTYEMFVDVGMLGTAQGTAWAVDEHHLVTAGHMCDEMAEVSVLKSTISERRIRAKAVLWEMGPDGHTDLCLLKTEQKLDGPLVIAKHMPYIGQDVTFVGWPLGVSVVSEGKYIGDMDGPFFHLNDDVFTAPCDHGASGSAIFTDRGVWGVLVRVRTDNDAHNGLMPGSNGPDSIGVHDGTDGCAAIALPELMSLLKDGEVDYTLTPDPLPPACYPNEQLNPSTNECEPKLG